MKRILNISSDAIQTHYILFNETEVTLKLRYFELSSHWIMDISYKNKSVKGVKLSLGTLHIKSNNLPFDFIVSSENGLDPHLIDSFSNDDCKLYLVEPTEIELIRGSPVEI